MVGILFPIIPGSLTAPSTLPQQRTPFRDGQGDVVRVRKSRDIQCNFPEMPVIVDRLWLMIATKL